MEAENESGFIVPPHRMEHSEGITGMSEIYVSQSGFFRISIARHLGRKVVIKSLKPECSSDPLALQQLNKEFALAFPIESRYVGRLLASLSLPDGTPAIEMEFCQGDTLRALFDRDGTFSSGEASSIVSSLLLGLEDIHRMGVVHRDIKPSNIIFDRDSRSLKIIDFGCAHSFDYISLRGPAGTIRYTPPEKRHGKNDPQPGDDLYAAGLVILELAGKCVDSRMARRLESFGKALSSRRYIFASEALEFFCRRKAGKRYLLPVAALAILLGAGVFLLLPGLPEKNGYIATTPSVGNDVKEIIIVPDSTHPATDPSPIRNSVAKASVEPLTNVVRTDSLSHETPPKEEDMHIPGKESDEELRRMAVQAGPMALKAKENYASDYIRGIAFAITSADSIYMHHLYEEFPKASHTGASLSKAIDSIYMAENPGLEKEYRRRAGKTFDRHRFKVLFTSRLEYMLKFNGATMDEAACFKSD